MIPLMPIYLRLPAACLSSCLPDRLVGQVFFSPYLLHCFVYSEIFLFGPSACVYRHTWIAYYPHTMYCVGVSNLYAHPTRSSFSVYLVCLSDPFSTSLRQFVSPFVCLHVWLFVPSSSTSCDDNLFNTLLLKQMFCAEYSTIAFQE